MKPLFHYSSLVALSLLLISLVSPKALARSPLDTFFPLEHYDQEITDWIDPSATSYDQELLGSDFQEKRTQELYTHLFGTLSPWSQNHVQALLASGIKHEEVQMFAEFSKAGTHYGDDSESATAYDQEWLASIQENSNLAQLDSLKYDSKCRGITTTNLAARVLPTDQHAFLNPMLPGEGDTFDYLQMSAVWVGTPVYVLATTCDGAWNLVITPDFIAWVKSEGVALADEQFVQSWSQAAQEQLVAITKTATPLQDEEGHLLSRAYVGACFPKGHSFSTMMVPSADQDHHATIQEIPVTSDMSADLPLSLTPHHMADIMGTLIGRPYAWGGMDFNNDCSAELKSLLTPFGIYLPRHSSAQVTVGTMVDKSALLPAERLSYLMDKGKPFLSLIHIGRHVMLYLGKYSHLYTAPDGSHQPFMAMTYQNLWGLSPNALLPSRRAIIGKAVLLPLLLQYSEDTTLVSLANKSLFQICDLSEFPAESSESQIKTLSFKCFDNRSKEKAVINLKSLMCPEPRGDF
ncbi:MAG: SH3 domain-containing protein [Chthoniobacterales bacterium]